MAVTAEIHARIAAHKTGANAYGGPDFNPVIDALYQLTDGTVADKADIVYAAERSFTSSTPDPIDLAGVLTDAFGAAITAAEIVALMIINTTKAGVRNTVALSVGAGSNPWFGMFGATGDIIKIPPGGMLLLVAPDANGMGTITAATADILNIAPGAAAGAYQIAILARTA